MRFSNFGSGCSRAFSKPVVFLFSVIILLSTACSTTHQITYFRDIPDTVGRKAVAEATYQTPVIQPDDILQVSIQTLDLQATAIMDQQNSASFPLAGTGVNNAVNSGATGISISGYLVDKNGELLLPLIGKIKVAGKTTAEVRDEIYKKATEYYKEPVVNVRFSNFKITVLGEVTRPSTYVMPNEKVSILDALGVAGDLTIYGKRENILVIRENEGKKDMIRMNLNDSKILTSPAFYLQQGDVVYVEPNKSKVIATDAKRLKILTVVTAATTLIVVIISRIKF